MGLSGAVPNLVILTVFPWATASLASCSIVSNSLAAVGLGLGLAVVEMAQGSSDFDQGISRRLNPCKARHLYRREW